MIDYEVIKTSLYNVISSIVTPTTVIFYYPNAPRPANPYITLNIDSLVRVGDDYIPKPDTDGDSTIVGDREFTLQVQSYGENCLTILEKIRSSLQKPSILDTLRDENIVFVNSLDITNITALLDTEWEQRGAMDLLFRIANTDEDNLGVIETVELDEEYSDGNTVVYSDTVTISSP